MGCCPPYTLPPRATRAVPEPAVVLPLPTGAVAVEPPLNAQPVRTSASEPRAESKNKRETRRTDIRYLSSQDVGHLQLNCSSAGGIKIGAGLQGINSFRHARQSIQPNTPLSIKTPSRTRVPHSRHIRGPTSRP